MCRNCRPPEIIGVGLNIFCRRCADCHLDVRQQPDLQLFDNGVGDFILYGEDVSEFPVVTLRPEMASISAIDKLPGHTHARTGLSNAALEQKGDAEFLGYLLYLHGPALVSERRVAGHNMKVRNLRQVSDDVFGDAVGKILLLRVATHVAERQDRDRYLPERAVSRSRLDARRWALVKIHAIAGDRSSDVLDLLITHRLEGKGELARDLSRDFARNADAAGLCKPLQAGGDVHTLPVAILALDDHLAEVDANADFQGGEFGSAGIALGHAALKCCGAFHRIHDTAEFRQQSVAHQFENAPVMLLDFRLEQFLVAGP